MIFAQTQPQAPEGSGTEIDPYLIANLANLRWLSECSEDWWIDLDTQVHILQTADIDAAETATWNNGSGFRPIAYDTNIGSPNNYRFIGVYNGDNYIISNLHISRENDFRYVGLFAQLYNSHIKNLHLIDIDFLVTDMNNISSVGGLAGATRYSNISNCSTTGIISHNTRTYHYTGGITGVAGYSTIENNFSTVNIIGTSSNWGSNAGGIAGQAGFSTIIYSYFTGAVAIYGNTYSNAGGIVGHAADIVNIESCYSTGEILANTNLSSNANYNSYAGGITGRLDYDSIIYNCYSTGEINSSGGYSSFAGGISGRAGNGMMLENLSRAIIDKSYSTGYITGSIKGSIVGYLDWSYILNSFWDIQTTQVLNAYAGETLGYMINSSGLSTFQMLQEHTFLDNGWDLEYTWGIEPNINNGYPHLNMIESPYKRISLQNVSILNNAISISWTSPPGPQPSTYTIYKNGSILAEGITEQFYLDDEFQNNHFYQYLVYGFYSEPESISVTSNMWEITPRLPPQNLTFQFSGYYVLLSWDPPYGGGNIAGYSISRNGISLYPNLTQQAYHDITTEPNTDYTYQVRAIYYIHPGHGYSDPVEVQLTTPDLNDENDDTDPFVKTELIGNYPNPFNPDTNINFSLSIASNLGVEIYNTKGQKIKTLVDEYYPAGEHNIVWNGTDDNGTSVASGVYFYRMVAGEYVGVGKMAMMK